VQQTHYRVGLQAFFLVCGTVLTGLVLLLPLAPDGTAYTVVDLAHMFCGFVFVLLLSAHLTLVALLTTARAPEAEKTRARASVSRLATVVTLLTCVVLAAAIAAA
jgi:cytochrome bd-type quinol oxidase subunit 2